MKMNVIYDVSDKPTRFRCKSLTFMPYCSFAIIGLSEIKVNSLRRHVNGRGTMSARKMNISVINMAKTCRRSKSKHVGSICAYFIDTARYSSNEPLRLALNDRPRSVARVGTEDLRGCSRASCLVVGCGLFTSGVRDVAGLAEGFESRGNTLWVRN